jgi:hypothetical protein
MKKKISGILIIILAILIFVSGCGKGTSVVKYEDGAATVSVDPRIELITIIENIAEIGSPRPLPFSYKDDVLDHFGEYKSHPAVKLFEEYYLDGFNYAKPMYFILCCNYNEGLLSLNEELYSKEPDGVFFKDKNEMNDFINQLNDFISVSKFDKFFNSNKDTYAKYISNYEENVNVVDVKKDLEEYYGTELKSYNIILGPMGIGGCEINIKNEGKSDDIYCILGPIDVEKNDSVFEMKCNNLLFNIRDFPKYVEYHEFSRSIIEPLIYKDIDEIRNNQKLVKLFEKVQDDMEQIGCNTVEGFVEELLVRSAVARLINKYDGIEYYYKRAIEYEKENGFIYIEEVCNSLENYEKNRDKYPTFESYYDEIIKCLSDIKTE